MPIQAGYTAAGTAPKIREIQAVALYDATGRIHHMHHVIVLEGGKSVEPEAAVREARNHAEVMGRDVAKLKTLHVPRVANPLAMHRVDVKKQVLVEIEQPKESASRRASQSRKQG